MALESNHSLALTLWLTVWTECSQAVLVWNRLSWSGPGSFLHLLLAGVLGWLVMALFRQLGWLGPLFPCGLSSSSKLGLAGVQEHQEEKPQWISFSQFSACTLFSNASSTKESHITNVVPRVREINDADLLVERAVKSHCKRAWIKKEGIFWLFLHLQQVILK